MILLLIVPVYLFLNYYVIRRIFHWLHLCSPHLKNRWFTATFVTLYALAASSLLFAFLLPSSGFQAAVRRFSNYWLGTFLYILLAILTADLIRLLLKYVFHIPEKFFRSAAALTLAGILAACLVLGGSTQPTMKWMWQKAVPEEKRLRSFCSLTSISATASPAPMWRA